MNVISATITAETIVVAERNESGLMTRLIAEESRPATFGEADTFLAFHSLARTEAWELTSDGLVEASVATVDNRFNGTVAARLDRAVGTTHEPFEVMSVHQVQDGDLIGDMELEGYAVVAGSRPMGDLTRVHMVSEGKTWSDRYSTDFPSYQLVQIARKR